LALRLEAMGLVPNKSVTVLRKASFGGPLHIRVGTTTELMIRRQEADLVMIRTH
jgi:ferrous iron transport protein A